MMTAWSRSSTLPSISAMAAPLVSVASEVADRGGAVTAARRHRSWPNSDTGTGQMRLRLADAIGAEMEDRRRQHGGGVAVADALDEMVERADAARGDDRNGDGVGDGTGEGNVEARFGAVAIHRGQQDLAGAAGRHALRPGHRIDAGLAPPAMGEHLPAAGTGLLGIDGDDDALAAEFLRRLLDEGGPRHGGGVDRRLVGAGEQQAPDIVDAAHAAAHGERHET